MGRCRAQVQRPALVIAIQVRVGPADFGAEGIATRARSHRNIVNGVGGSGRRHNQRIGPACYLGRIGLIPPRFHDRANTNQSVISVTGIVHTLKPIRH